MSSFAVLGLLSNSPASGYQLAQEVDGAISNFWPMSKSNIYLELTRLEALRLVEADDVSQVKLPNKRVFHLTEAGERALDAWLAEPTVRKERRKNSLLVKMLFANRLTTGQISALVDAARQEAEHERDRLAGRVEALSEFPSTYSARSTALFGLRHAEATIIWADEMNRALNEDGAASSRSNLGNADAAVYSAHP